MIKWQFRSYLLSPESGPDVVREWMERQGLGVQGAIAGQLSVCRIQPLLYWQERRFHAQLEDELSALEELRFEMKAGRDARKESYRILGFSDQSRCEFTMLYPFFKTRGQLDYDEFGLIALQRMAQVRTNRRYSTEANWLNNYD